MQVSSKLVDRAWPAQLEGPLWIHSQRPAGDMETCFEGAQSQTHDVGKELQVTPEPDY